MGVCQQCRWWGRHYHSEPEPAPIGRCYAAEPQYATGLTVQPGGALVTRAAFSCAAFEAKVAAPPDWQAIALRERAVLDSIANWGAAWMRYFEGEPTPRMLADFRGSLRCVIQDAEAARDACPAPEAR